MRVRTCFRRIGAPLLLLLLGAVLAGCDRPATRHRITAPDFGLADISGSRFFLSQHRGRVVVCTFWSTACIPCRKELQELATGPYARSDSEEVILAAVCTDPGDEGAVRRLTAEWEGHLKILLDRDGEVTRRYGVKSVPTTLLIDREGKIAFRHVGYSEMSLPLLYRMIDTLTNASETAQ